jgi:CRISPR-associated protein Cmr3
MKLSRLISSWRCKFMYILLTLLEPSLFRWHGEYSPNYSGPMNRGISEPLPLISTIAGALYWKIYGINTSDRDTDAIKEGFDKIWGPLIYVEGALKADGNGERYVLVHHYPGRLSVYRVEKDIITSVATKEGKAYEVIPLTSSKIGVGLDMSSKIAAEHLLYSQQLIDLRNTIYSYFTEVKRWGILVRVDKDVGNVSGLMSLGADGRLAKVISAPDISLPNSQGCEKSVVLSPVLVTLDRERGSFALFDELLNVTVENQPIKNIIADEARVDLIGIGYSALFNIRRPMYLAIMPGSRLKNVSKDSIGFFKELGWGSLLRFCEEQR